MKVFADSAVQDGRMLREWSMLQAVSAYPAWFVHLRGWTEFGHRLAFVTDYISTKRRHFEPASTRQALAYAVGMLEVCSYTQAMLFTT